MDILLSAWTVLVAVLFLGIVAWAWSRKRKTEFDRAARIPLEDDEPTDVKGENENG